MSHPDITTDDLRALANYASVALNTLPKELTVGGQGLVKRVEKWIAAMEKIDLDPITKRSVAQSILDQGVPEGAEIERSMVLSTAHVTEETAKWLEDQGLLLVYAKSGYGYWIWAGEEQMAKAMPSDLLILLKAADDAGCEWLVLDNDGPVVEEFEAYEW